MAASVAHSQLAARHSSLAGDATPTVLRSSSLSAQAAPSRPSSAAKKAARLCVRSSSAQQNSQEESVLGQVARGAASLALAGLLSLSPIAANVVPAAAAQAALNPAISDVSVLIKGQPIKDAKALLRYALPITNQPIKDVQLPLELISEDLRVPGVKALDGVERNIRQANRILNQNKAKILADVNPDKKAEGEALVERLQDGLQEFQRIVERKDRGAVPAKQKELLAIVGDIEEAMVLAFPFEIPDELKDNPWLRGRATLEMVVNPINNRNVSEYVMEIVVDGYNAPISAGNFVDLVQRGFYNGMEIQRADGFVVQTGDPDGPSEGFVDPKTGKVRTIPLEVFAEGDKAPIYHETLEELGRYKALSRLPFNAFGTMAMAREEFDNDSASSQVFWLLKESELTPSSANILDGRYAVFGYITENEDLLADLKVGDIIKSITVKQGLDNLVNPTY